MTKCWEAKLQYSSFPHNFAEDIFKTSKAEYLLNGDWLINTVEHFIRQRICPDTRNSLTSADLKQITL